MQVNDFARFCSPVLERSRSSGNKAERREEKVGLLLGKARLSQAQASNLQYGYTVLRPGRAVSETMMLVVKRAMCTPAVTVILYPIAAHNGNITTLGKSWS